VLILILHNRLISLISKKYSFLIVLPMLLMIGPSACSEAPATGTAKPEAGPRIDAAAPTTDGLPAVPAADLPKAMAWSAYNLGTTGYNQAVAVGKVLKDHYETTLRVVPGKNDVSRLLPLMKQRVQFSANGSATYFAQEGVQQFAAANWGPLPLRLVFMSNGDSNQAIAVAADTGIRTLAELKGKRVPYVRGAPAVNVTIEAFLACADLGWDDVVKVEFPGYGAMWNGIVNGQIDAAYANTVSGPTRKLEASPRGIFWPPVPHADKACWDRARATLPILTPHFATRGPGISDADLDWVVPFHEGSVRYLRAVGVWSDALDTHNNALIKRQQVLADAWLSYTQTPGENFAADWMTSRAAALTAAGMDPVWNN